MNKIIKKITNKNLDFSSIPFSYTLKKILKYIMNLFRGLLRKIFINKSGKMLLIGKKCNISCSKKIFLGDYVRIEDYVYIDAYSSEGLSIGNSSKIGSFSRILCSGSLKNMGKGLKVGDNSYFGEYTFFGAAGGIEVGNNVISGQNVRFHSENHNFDDLNILIMDQGVTNKGIFIGNNVWIGSGVVFLDGAYISDGCVIGANSVVRGFFEENSVILGQPAKIKRKRG